MPDEVVEVGEMVQAKVNGKSVPCVVTNMRLVGTNTDGVRTRALLHGVNLHYHVWVRPPNQKESVKIHGRDVERILTGSGEW